METFEALVTLSIYKIRYKNFKILEIGSVILSSTINLDAKLFLKGVVLTPSQAIILVLFKGFNYLLLKMIENNRDSKHDPYAYDN